MTEPLGAPFAKLLSASVLSNLADGVLKIALPLIAIRYTESPMLIAGLSLALSLPWLLFALPIGAVADRVDRRQAMLAGNAARGAVAAFVALAVLGDVGSIWLLYAAGFVFGTAEVLYDTTSQSILPAVVPKAQLTRANSRLYAGEVTTNQFVGPPLGGFLVAIGAVYAAGAPAALWSLAFVFLLSMPGRFRPERTGPRTTLRADVAEGLRYLAGHRVLRTLALMTGTSNLASSAAFSVFVLFAVGEDSPMGLTEAGFGVLNTTIAAGAILGTVVADRVARRIGRPASLGFAVAAFTGMLATPILTTSPWLIGGTWVIAGLGLMMWNIIAVSLRQAITPDHLLGRVNSCYRLLAWGTMPLGALAGGVIGELLGLRAVFAFATVVSALTALGLLVVTERAIAAAEAADEPDAVVPAAPPSPES